MKAFVRNIVFGNLLLLMSMVSVNVSANPLPLIGDVNGDDCVTMTDAVITIDYILGNPVADFNFTAADVNGDGIITITDVGCIINLVLGHNQAEILDTIKISFQDNKALIDGSFDEHTLLVSMKGAKVKVKSSGKKPFACLLEGNSSNGSLEVDADTTCSLILNNIQLTSCESAAINITKKQKVSIELPDGSQNVLCDATSREEKDGTNACLYSKGTLTFTGKGALTVSGKYGHGIASSKNISIDGCHVTIADVVKNGLHCDKFTLKEGQVNLHLFNQASKGIKAKEELFVKGGSIEGEATSGIINENGDISYSSLLKSDGMMLVSGGSITLKHSGDGARCISVDKDLTVTGGIISLECFGDGGQYLNTENEQDYYTPKCVTVDDSVKIASGIITCLSTGLGGKGIVAGKHLSIGSQQNDKNLVSPVIRIETKGECIINNVNEDLRFGCPKGIKSDSILIVYDGDIEVSTAGMGGEGLESNGKMFVYGGKMVCNTFDDGINVADSIEIAGGHVYCCSADNDGIDSNGSITISGGIVASVNQKKPNESFDAEKGRVFLKGGTVFGIGSGPVDLAEAVYPCYSTPYDVSEEWMNSRGLILTKGKYICVQRGNEVIMALRNDNQAFRSFLTIMSSLFSGNEQYTISEGDCPLSPLQSYFDNRLVIGGDAFNINPVTDEYFQIIK